MAPAGAYMTSVLVTLGAALPLFAVVQSLVGLRGEDLVPCTDAEPCHFLRVFEGGGLPSTAGELVEVKNGVSRPVMLEGMLAGSVVVPYMQTAARVRILGFGYFAGGFRYLWPDENGVGREVWQWCFLGVCFDDKFQPGFGPWRAGPRVRNAQLQIKRSSTFVAGHRGSTHLAEALGYATSTRNLFWRVLTYSVYGFVRGPKDLYTYAFAKAGGVDLHRSGPELLPSGRCGVMNKTEMQEFCEKEDIMNKVGNPFDDSRSIYIYLFSIVLWAVSKVVHDILLLADVTESVTIPLGMSTQLFQVLAVGSGMLTTMTALEIYISQIDDGMRNGQAIGEACGCFYKMEDLAAILLISTPLALLVSYVGKHRNIILSVTSGDFLHYLMVVAPHRIVRQEPEWHTLSLQLPSVSGGGTSAPPEVEALSPKAGQLCVLLLVFQTWLENLGLYIPTALAFSVLVPRYMTVMTSVAQDPRWTAPHANFVCRLLLLVPTIAFVVCTYMVVDSGPVPRLTNCVAAKCRLPKDRANSMLAIIIAVLAVPASALLWPYGGLWNAAASVAPEKIHIWVDVWTVGGFWLSCPVILAMKSIFSSSQLMPVAVLHLTRSAFAADEKEVPFWLGPASQYLFWQSRIWSLADFLAWAENNGSLVASCRLQDTVDLAKTLPLDTAALHWQQVAQKRVVGKKGNPDYMGVPLQPVADTA